ncbi:MAG: hypothetical protein II773_13050 [Oscillospiraceae bacterium]|nr:hypothetical protein [Oscillospiraceae bacterium]
MGNTKRKSLLSTYLTAVPFWAGAVTNFFAGAVCRLMITVFLIQNTNAVNIAVFSAATLFSALMLNSTSYLMCSTFIRKSGDSGRRVPASLAVAGFAAAFIIGIAAAPELVSLISRG